MFITKYPLSFTLFIVLLMGYNFALGGIDDHNEKKTENDITMKTLAENLAKIPNFSSFMVIDEHDDSKKIDFDLFYRSLLLALNEVKDTLSKDKTEELLQAMHFSNARRVYFSQAFKSNFKQTFRPEHISLTILFMVANIQHKKTKEIELTEFETLLLTRFDEFQLQDEENKIIDSAALLDHCDRKSKLSRAIMYPDDASIHLWRFFEKFLPFLSQQISDMLKEYFCYKFNQPSLNEDIKVSDLVKKVFNNSRGNSSSISKVLEVIGPNEQLEKIIIRHVCQIFSDAVCKKIYPLVEFTPHDISYPNSLDLIDLFIEEDALGRFCNLLVDVKSCHAEIELSLLTNGYIRTYLMQEEAAVAKIKAEARAKPEPWEVLISATPIDTSNLTYAFNYPIIFHTFSDTKQLYIASTLDSSEVEYKYKQSSDVRNASLKMRYTKDKKSMGGVYQRSASVKDGGENNDEYAKGQLELSECLTKGSCLCVDIDCSSASSGQITTSSVSIGYYHNHGRTHGRTHIILPADFWGTSNERR